MAIRIMRTNPRTGRIERPWLNREGFFVLGDPAHGAQKHHDKFAVKVETLEDVAAHIGRGFSVRMTDGESPPSLIAPQSLTIEQIEDSNQAPLWVETTPKPPFTKDEMMEELKLAMLVQANQIAHAGALSYALAFMGFETVDPVYPYCHDDPKQVDLRRFSATDYLGKAYDYAFQVGQYWHFGDDTAQDVSEFVWGANQQASDGNSSPLYDPDKCCRRAADTAFGRWKLDAGLGLTVRELALLGNMKEAAVRNSLSKERISLQRGEVDPKIALAWLQQRRDFVATKIEQASKENRASWSKFTLSHYGFQDGFAKIMADFPMAADELATKAAVPVNFIEALLRGKPIPDLEALRRVGAALELDEPHFAGVAVEAALSK